MASWNELVTYLERLTRPQIGKPAGGLVARLRRFFVRRRTLTR
jgi:hypothetical protein